MPGNVINHELVASIYHAASDAHRWRDVLERLRIQFDAQAVLMARHDLGSGEGERLCDVGLDRGGIEEFAPLNPWMHRANAYQSRRVVVGEEIVSNADLMREAFYREFLRPHDCLHRLCGVIARQGEEIWVVSLFRRPAQRVFCDAERRTLTNLLPHFAQSLELQWQLARERTGRQLLLDVLDQLPSAIVLVDPELRPVVVSAAAEAALALNDGLMISNAKLHALWRTESERLECLVADACRKGNGHPAPVGGHLTVTRPSGLRPFLVIVNPLRRMMVDATGHERAIAAVVIKDPEIEPHTSPRSRRELAELYELTPAEARLLGLILDGLSLFEAAQRLGITRNTSRTHMKRIYSKTGTHRQAELVRRLTRFTNEVN